MRRKNSYRFSLGPTDAEGELRITAEQLSGMARNINSFFLMDYVGLDAGWTGEIIIKPVDQKGLTRLRGAYETWGESGFYGSDFASDLDRLESALQDADGVPVVTRTSQQSDARITVTNA
jgi:hypothetical protein